MHSSLLADLNALDAIGGLCSTRYITSPELLRRLRSGRVVDCGNSVTPDLEQIIMLQPQLIMLSTFENKDQYGKVRQLGIPIVECADFLETSPLGRAEWVRFYGRLFGRAAEADSMFADSERRYLALQQLVDGADARPKVIFDRQFGQSWNVPASRSVMAAFIRDAGGVNPFDYIAGSGNVPVTPEQVLVDAHDASVWFVRYNQQTDKTMAELADDAAINTRFQAYRDGAVYGCNTRTTGYYDEVSFRPHLLLRDMITAIHPEAVSDTTMRYFTLMK